MELFFIVGADAYIGPQSDVTNLPEVRAKALHCALGGDVGIAPYVQYSIRSLLWQGKIV